MPGPADPMTPRHTASWRLRALVAIAAAGALLAGALLAGCGTPTAATPASGPPISPAPVLGRTASGPAGTSGPSTAVQPGGPATPSASAAATARTTADGRPRAALSGVGAADRVAWASWRGQPVGVNETWNDAKDSSGAITWASMDGLYSTRQNFSGGRWKGALSIAQPMFADNETVQSCASAAEITTWARDLKAAWPSGSAFIRLGWEFNGDWYHWSVQPGDATAFKTCWIKWYELVKHVSSGFDLVWNPNNQSTDPRLDVRDFWPGAAYVDAAGPDAYALSYGGTVMSPDRTGPNGEPLGIGAWAAWVAGKGVPLAVPEWAIRDQTWGSTSPTYIEQMRSAFVAAARSRTGLAYESYFDGGTAYQCQFSIHDPACGDVHPAAAAAYRSLWSKPYPA
jgi:Glycosyl hydrolase family 26